MRSSSGPERRAWYSIVQRGPRRQAPAPSPPPHRQARVAFFGTGKLRLSSTLPAAFPMEPKSLAEHLVRARKSRGLLQREAAALMGVCCESLERWERGKHPSDRHWPRVVTFLGHDPSAPAISDGQRLTSARRGRGLSMKGLARALRCDEATVAKWESGEARPDYRHRRTLRMLFGGDTPFG